MPKRLNEEIKVILRELRPNALWDAIKLVGLGVLAMLGLAVTSILQRLRGVPPDVRGIIILGIAWLVIVFVAYMFGKLRRNRTLQGATNLQNHDAPHLAILLPQPKWHIGSRFTIRGLISPPDASKVQLLIQPAGEAWELFSDVQIYGPTWVRNHRFGEATYYRIVAVYGDTLKQRFYDEPPPNIIKSEVVSVYRRRGEPDFIDCPDKELHQTKIEDSSQINNLVIVSLVRYQKVQEGNAPAHIEFVFSILNMSLIPVSVDSLEGHITYFIDGEFYSAKLPPTLELKEKASNLGFRQSGWFKVQQDFKTEGEANHLLNASPDTTLFQFNSLNIRVLGDGCSMTVDTTNVSFKKRDYQWAQRDEIDFILTRLANEERKQKALEKLKRRGVEFEVSTMIRNSTVLLTEPGDAENWRDAVVHHLEAKLFIRFYNNEPEPIRVDGLSLSIINDTTGKEWPLTLHIMPPNFRRPNAQDNEYFQGLMVGAKEMTDWYFFQYWMDIPKDCALSVDKDCYLRVSMDARQPDSCFVDLKVHWKAARKREFSVSNRNPDVEINCL